ncbi:MAG: Eco57I restriction-modification methylase domain-containing protein, partial [Bacteroidaceae bacterium]|nr:Eco57I restriction-modification methylase domain-containing protein [Bacteroidaceae bacterium]
MNKNTFTSCLSTSDFRSLFIREMGWNNPQGQTSFDITIEGETYSFNQIAEKSGFQVILCKIDVIPTSSMCKRIDTRLRRQANDYICIYHMPGSQHHLWVAPVKKVEKRDLVLVEYESAEKAGFLYEKIDDLSFDLDEVTTIMDVKERIQHTFVVNSDKITKDFYAGFRKEHTNFAKFISGIDDQITDIKKNRNKQWYTSVMLNRLMFCYFIQKKGFLDQNTDYLSDKLRWVKQNKGKNKFYGFYRGFLLSLFHDGLNEPLHENDFIEKYGRIPYLNGGMFSIHELEEQYKNIDIKDEAFESLFAFFDQWHWHLDDRLTASGRDINPDVLGYIFEQYINDRAQMGAYYTKEDITEYIGRNTIVPYLMDATKKMDEKPFKTNGAVWNFLKQSGDTYIDDAVKKGVGLDIPEEIAVGIDTTKPNLLERRSHWNERTPEEYALPTEIWRETIERLQRYDNIKNKIENGEIHEINDFITYNLDIRPFVQDLLAQTDDHLFVLHFYHALQKVTILDPTCGSGAFLFAALNILEPLYEICISRMQDWQAQNPNLFKDELEELNVKYRSNIRYFIYKSIILRNLYGVDIMVEATEIAKLRLFLKMVAVVDVNPRDPNLGLEPLPDVDFNIRCGNTLVGYATKTELDNDLKFGDMFEKMEFEQKVKDKIKVVSKAFAVFKEVQLTQTPNLETYKVAKKQLKETLGELNELLNQKMYSQVTALSYEKWLSSHQPFHWFAEYYDIIEGNGGFDVIIGNPPYVEISKNKLSYSLSSYRYKFSDLYAYVLYRIKEIANNFDYIGFIIPISFNSTPGFSELYKTYRQGCLYLSCYADTAKMFQVTKRLTIVLKLPGKSEVFSTHYIKNSISMSNRLAECPYCNVSDTNLFEDVL